MLVRGLAGAQGDQLLERLADTVSYILISRERAGRGLPPLVPPQSAEQQRQQLADTLAGIAAESLNLDTQPQNSPLRHGTPLANLLALARGKPTQATRQAIGGAIGNSGATIVLDDNVGIPDADLYRQAEVQIRTSLLTQLDAINRTSSAGGFQLTEDMIPMLSAQAAGQLVQSMRPGFTPPQTSTGSNIAQLRSDLRVQISNSVQTEVVAEANNAVALARAEADTLNVQNVLWNGPLRGLAAMATGVDPADTIAARRVPSAAEKTAMGNAVASAVDRVLFCDERLWVGQHRGKFFSELTSDGERRTALREAIYEQIGGLQLGDPTGAGHHTVIDEATRQRIARKAAERILEQARSTSLAVGPQRTAANIPLVPGDQGRPSPTPMLRLEQGWGQFYA